MMVHCFNACYTWCRKVLTETETLVVYIYTAIELEVK